jgi:hypothetical protein
MMFWPRRSMQKMKVYIFADRFMSQKLKDAILEGYLCDLNDSDSSPTYRFIIHAFANLPDTDPLLRFLVDHHCRNFRRTFDDPYEIQDRALLPQAFLVRVMLRYSDMVAKTPKVDLCEDDYRSER